VNEDTIVRELLFVFQGIDGKLIKYQILEDAYILSPQVTVSPSAHKLISELCELGWLYRKVNEWVTRNGGDSMNQSVNQVTQSLCFVVQAELTEYYRLLAVLDSQRTNYTSEDAANYLNLRKLYLWI
jgi:gamma-tubulin complex component 3